MILVIGAQCGKTEAIFDIIGERLDRKPSPTLYVGPTKQFITEQLEPRLIAMLEDTACLAGKLQSGKSMTKTRKVVSGVPLRLAHGGSSTALKSDPFCLACTDEVDELLSNVKGQGDPLTLIDARGDTHADFVHVITSTPSEGLVTSEVDPKSGLEFWSRAKPDEVKSKVWQLWQDSTLFHWSWKCPHCLEWFIPRHSCLHIPDARETTPSRAKEEARLVCPRNGCVIDSNAIELNKTGQYVAPGQWFEDDVVCGELPESDSISFWASGLVSPFKSFGDRASALVAAMRSGDPEQIRAVINAGFAELWSPVGGDAPEWAELKALSLPYMRGDVPEGARYLTAGVDVQKNRLVYAVRAWGYQAESWLVDYDEIWGDTSHDQVWDDLAEQVLYRDYCGFTVKRAVIDAGFRPGKRELVPEHKVYEFCRRHAHICYASKGYAQRASPVSVKRIDVASNGSRAKYGLDLVRIDTDFTKSWVHAKLRWPSDQPGGWHTYENAPDEYLRQIVSEVRVSKPGGQGNMWVQKYRENHALDVEAQAFAAAFMLGVLRLVRPRAAKEDAQDARGAQGAPPAPSAPAIALSAAKPPRPAKRRVSVSSYF